GTYNQAVNVDRTITLVVQEGGVTFGSLDDSVTTATINLSGVTLTAGGNGNSTQVDSNVLGAGNLIKAGGGTLTLAGVNSNAGGGSLGFTENPGGFSFTLGNVNNSCAGATLVTSGTLAVAKLAAGGAASSIGASTSAAGNLTLQGGAILDYSGGTASTDRSFT